MKQKIKYIFKALLCATTSIVIAASAAPQLAYAVTAAEKQAEARVALQNLQDLQSQLDSVSDIYYGALQAKEEAEKNIEESKVNIAEAEAKIDKLQQRISTRAVAMYKSGSSSILDLLFGATTFEEFATSWDLLSAMNSNDASLVSETKKLKSDIEEQQKIYEEAVKTAEEMAASVADSYQLAANLTSAARATYNSLNSEAKALYAAENASYGGGTTYSYNLPAVDYGNDIVARAVSKLGCEYVWGAYGPDSFDCSGFVGWCYGYSGHPWSSSYLMTLPSVSDPQPGDVMVVSGHCGIYCGGDTIIHASTYGIGVVYGSLSHYSNYKIVRPN